MLLRSRTNTWSLLTDTFFTGFKLMMSSPAASSDLALSPFVTPSLMTFASTSPFSTAASVPLSTTSAIKKAGTRINLILPSTIPSIQHITLDFLPCKRFAEQLETIVPSFAAFWKVNTLTKLTRSSHSLPSPSASSSFSSSSTTTSTTISSSSISIIPRAERRAAVYVPFCTVNGELCLLFTKRSGNVGTHKSEVSFPGGHMDECDDGSPFVTACREMEEEIGVTQLTAAQSLVGSLEDCPSKHGTMVTPVVGMLGEVNLKDLSANSHEVDSVFARSISSLLTPGSFEWESLGNRGMVPRFVQHDDRSLDIWGLTGYITARVLTELLNSIRHSVHLDPPASPSL